MIKVLSVYQMRRAEQAVLVSTTLVEENLVDIAATKIVDEIGLRFSQSQSVAVFCGGGNNGCDGLSAAIMLERQGHAVSVVDLNLHRNGLNAKYLDRAVDSQIPIINLSQFKSHEPKFDIIIDAIFGVGLNRQLDQNCVEAISAINSYSAYVIAADIPSGLNADSGKNMGAAVEADLTITFAAIKLGHYINEGRNFIGEIVTADIGVPIMDYSAVVYEQEDCKILERKTVSHKGNYGRINIMGGSKEMPGSVLLTTRAATAALRSGAGLVSLCVADSMRTAYQSRVEEATLILMPDDDGYISFDRVALDRVMSRANVIAMGMGMGSNPHLTKIINYFATKFGGILVLDADAINALAKDLSIVEAHKCKLILTPHMGEFERLYNSFDIKDNSSTLSDIDRVKFVAKHLDATIAAKSATTIITDGQDVVLNITGTPAMAKGGSGDVLAGVVSAFAATDTTVATAKACWHFGKWGEKATEIHGELSVLASDIIKIIK